MSFFIAEVSSNHYRDLDRCCAFVDAAAKAGCQAIKFQLFKIDQLFAPEILKRSAEHRRRKDWELPTEFLPRLADICRENQIQLSCTPFYLRAVEELALYVDFYKIASYELLWDDLLIACARSGKPVVLSTGMANLSEIVHAVDVLQKSGCKNPTLLHCTSAYPTPCAEANLSAIETIRIATGCDVGWSDHTVEAGVIHRAIHRWGAKAVEFHLDLDGTGPEYAAGHCWLPSEISAVISDVENALAADGAGIKEPAPSEMPDRDWRADPKDGLRPMQSIRTHWMP